MKLFRRSRSACRRYDLQLSDTDNRSAIGVESHHYQYQYEHHEQPCLQEPQLPLQWSSSFSADIKGEHSSSSCQGVTRGREEVNRVAGGVGGGGGSGGSRVAGSWRSFAAYQLGYSSHEPKNKKKDEVEEHLLGNCFGLGIADVVVVACRDVTSSDQLTQTEFEFVGSRRHTLQYTPRTSTLPLNVASPGSHHRQPLSPGNERQEETFNRL